MFGFIHLTTQGGAFAVEKSKLGGVVLAAIGKAIAGQ